jgi:hypothetical protein
MFILLLLISLRYSGFTLKFLQKHLYMNLNFNLSCIIFTGDDPSRMIREIPNHQEDEEGNTIKFLHFEQQNEEKDEEMSKESINKRIIKNRVWKIHISVGKTFYGFLHFHAKKVKKWDFKFPLQYEGISQRGNMSKGAFYKY